MHTSVLKIHFSPAVTSLPSCYARQPSSVAINYITPRTQDRGDPIMAKDIEG